MSSNWECLIQELHLIKKNTLREFITEFIDECVPEYFYVIPASSTGKYHPAYALGDGGLVRHTKAAVWIAHDLLSLKQNEQLSKVWHDEIIAALIIHDTFKQGLDNKKGVGRNAGHTKFEHPLIAAEALQLFAKELHPEMVEDARVIARLVKSHMGQWNRSDRSKVILPTPQTEVECFVHMCDYLASRKYLTVDVKYEPKAKEEKQAE